MRVHKYLVEMVNVTVKVNGKKIKNYTKVKSVPRGGGGEDQRSGSGRAEVVARHVEGPQPRRRRATEGLSERGRPDVAEAVGRQLQPSQPRGGGSRGGGGGGADGDGNRSGLTDH